MFEAAVRRSRNVLRERARLAYSAPPGTKHAGRLWHARIA